MYQESKTEETQENKTMLELEDKTYRLEEMSDAISASISNIEEVIGQQNLLVEVVSSSNKADQFGDFCKDVEQQIQKLDIQKQALIVKKSLIDQIVIECKENKDSAKLMTMLVEALGVFQN